MNTNDYPEKAFLLSGLSECGKSTAGMYFDSIGIKRMKLVKVLAYKEMKKNKNINPYEYAVELAKEKGEIFVAQKFIDNLTDICNRENTRYCSVESLIYRRNAEYIKSKMPDRFIITYIDMPEKERLKRQMIRSRVDIEEAKKIMLPRDKIKMSHGAHEIKNIADVVINNEGSLEELYSQLLKMSKKYCKLE